MENTDAANTSAKSDKKAKKSKNAEAILHLEAHVKPRRSFWRALFRRNPKTKVDANAEGKAAVMSPRLNAIYEEAKSSEDINDDNSSVEDFKTILKQISPEVLLEPGSPSPSPPDAPAKAASLELVSGASSTSSASVPPEQPNTAPEPIKEYSFEYSETSDSSDAEENKVKFVETVEQKDADSNIVVKDLNPGEEPEQPAAQLETDADDEGNAEQPANLYLSSAKGFSKSLPGALDTASTYRLDNFFKMVVQTSDLTYTVSYDPLLSNFNFNLPKTEPFPSEKVARKRKMSLLNDKTKMAECLKEIELQQEKCRVSVPQNTPKPQIPPQTQNEQVLYLLENTREKLQNHIDQKIDPKVLNLFDIFSQSSKAIIENEPEIIASNRTFRDGEKEIDVIFKELFVHINELKDTCIINGCLQDNIEPLITMTPLVETTIVKPILDEVLDKVFQSNIDNCDNLEQQISNKPESTSNSLPETQSSQPRAQNSAPRQENFDSDYSSEDETTPDIKKSQKFGPLHKKMDPIFPTVTNFTCNNPPDITESLKHIFFGGEAEKSDFNLIEPLDPHAGTSRPDSYVPPLPSVPSTPLSLSSDSSQTQITQITTLKDPQDTEMSSTSLLNVDSNLGVFNNYSLESGTKNISLERKGPETNLFQPSEDRQPVHKSPQDNVNILKVNSKKTINILNNSASDDSLSILSTITENVEIIESLTEPDRYPEFIPKPQHPKPDLNNS